MILKDSIFKIGKTHTVCQDYAIHKQSENVSFKQENIIALSDGCSGAPDTDFGSRFLVKTFVDYSIGNRANYHKIIDCAEILNLDLYCLSATLLMARTLKEDSFEIAVDKNDKNSLLVSIFGDGVYAFKTKDNLVKIVQYESGQPTDNERTRNAPYYPIYNCIPGGRQRYIEEFGDKKTITEYSVFPGQITKSQTIVNIDEKCEFVLSFDNLKSFFLFSDGIDTFYKVIKTETSKYTEQIPLVDAVLEVMNCPTFGPFLEKKYTKMSEKEGVHHADDLSVAAFLFQEDVLI